MASSHSQTRPRSDVGPELRALRGVLKRAEREFAVECGVLPTELAAFEAGEQPLSPTLAAGLRRALAAVPDAWQHAFPTLRRLTDPPALPRNEVLISRTASGVDADGRPQYVEVYEVIDCPDARTYVREHSVTEVM